MNFDQPVPKQETEKDSFINVHNFFKTKENGGIFAYVDKNILDWLDTEIKNSLAAGEFKENITEKSGVITENSEVIKEVDLSYIKQMCERHILKGEKILKEDYLPNYFLVRGKEGELHELIISMLPGNNGWCVYPRTYPDMPASNYEPLNT